MTTVFTLYVINSANTLFGHSDSAAMFSFGEFFSLQGEKSNYAVWELTLFLFVGVMGGFIGALFNLANQRVINWRRQYVHTSAIGRMGEVFLLVVLMTTLSFFLPIIVGNCTALPVDMEAWSDQEKGLVEELVPLYCQEDTQYNELASLFLTDSDTSIRQLFHFREVGDHLDSTFSSLTLFIFDIFYIVMACLTCGSSVPAGMFVPSLLSGAAFGRLVGHILHKVDNTHGTFADSGTYALMGAAAITAGIARMTISLTVMVLEATGDMQYVLPLMLTVMSARFVGNMFSEGLYDMMIHTNHLNYLDEDEGIPILTDVVDINVTDIMVNQPLCLPPIVRVGIVYDLLKKTTHNCYPIGKQKPYQMFLCLFMIDLI